ncbi:MAG: hypothetical protein QME94_00280 [Anaerolineae bacterium]|nr:hypothetical protein [Anaerolineae bacterium]
MAVSRPQWAVSFVPALTPSPGRTPRIRQGEWPGVGVSGVAEG